MIDPEIKKQLAEFRQSIDNIDAALVHILAERFRCTKAVGMLKATHDLPPADPAAPDETSGATGGIKGGWRSFDIDV